MKRNRMQKLSVMLKNIMNRIMTRNQRVGFTMIELVVVIAIMAVLSTVGVASLTGYRGKQNLKKTTDEVVAAIVGTQKRSISQDAGKRWNVRFSNTTSSGSQYIVFSGTSYATSAIDKIYGLNRNIIFSEPYTSSTFDAFFAPFAGTLSSKKIISMVTGKKDGFVGDIIMNTAGRVEGRNESGLVGYWHLDENTSTTAYDASGMGSAGVFVGSPTWKTGTNCVSGSCLGFSGSGQYIDAGTNSILGTNPFTLSAWINATAVTNYGGAISIGTSVAGQAAYIGTVQTAQVGTSNSIGGGFYATNYGSGITTTGQWVHVAMTFAGGTNGAVKIYVNGQNPISTTYTPNLGTAVKRIGRIGTDPTYDFNGSIDEVRVYNRALSATEILNIYNDLK